MANGARTLRKRNITTFFTTLWRRPLESTNFRFDNVIKKRYICDQNPTLSQRCYNVVVPAGKDSKKWWKECRRICGMERSQSNLAIKLLSNPSATKSNMLTLASDINKAVLQPQKRFDLLHQSYNVHIADSSAKYFARRNGCSKISYNIILKVAEMVTWQG